MSYLFFFVNLRPMISTKFNIADMRKIFTFLAVASMVGASVSTNAQQTETLKVRRGLQDTVYKAKHIIVGLATPSGKVSVNGNPVHVYKTGSWGTELTLNEGNNSVVVKEGAQEVKFDVFYSTTPKKVVRNLEKEAEEAKKAAFVPTSLKVSTKKYAYLNYGAGTDRLGGAKINYLPEGVEMYADAENENLYRVKISQNRYVYIPKSQVNVVEKVAPAADFMQNNVVLSGSFSVYNEGDADKVSMSVGGKKPYIVKEYADPHKIVVDLYGVQCNSNWITHRKGLKSVENVDVESIDSDVTRVTVYLKTKSSWGFSMDYRGNNLVLSIKNVPTSLYLKDMIIGLDAGHGGPESSGAVSNSGVKEKDINLSMVYILKEILEKQGAKVVLSRTDDSGLTMRERQDKFIEGGADIVISVHNNAGGSPLTTGGTSTYYRYNVYKPLAEKVVNNLRAIPGVKDYGMTGNFNFSLSAITDFPCILVEALFMSNLWDEEQMVDPKFQRLMMQNVADGLVEYIKECRIAEGQAKK